jgi:hypothetical protein
MAISLPVLPVRRRLLYRAMASDARSNNLSNKINTNKHPLKLVNLLNLMPNLILSRRNSSSRSSNRNNNNRNNRSSRSSPLSLITNTFTAILLRSSPNSPFNSSISINSRNRSRSRNRNRSFIIAPPLLVDIINSSLVA